MKIDAISTLKELYNEWFLDSAVNPLTSLHERQEWFVNWFKSLGILPYAELIDAIIQPDAVRLLIDAYVLSGTRQALLSAGQAIFGADSTVILNEEPGKLIINIKNAITFDKFGIYLVDELTGDAIATYASDDDDQPIGTYLIEIVEAIMSTGGIINFFKLFAPPQVVIESVNILSPPDFINMPIFKP